MLPAPCLPLALTLPAPCWHPACIQPVPRLHAARTLPAPCLHSACTLLALARTLLAPCSRSACSPPPAALPQPAPLQPRAGAAPCRSRRPLQLSVSELSAPPHGRGCRGNVGGCGAGGTPRCGDGERTGCAAAPRCDRWEGRAGGGGGGGDDDGGDGIVESWNILSWRRPIGIIECNSWFHAGPPKNQIVWLRVLSKCCFCSGSWVVVVTVLVPAMVRTVMMVTVQVMVTARMMMTVVMVMMVMTATVLVMIMMVMLVVMAVMLMVVMAVRMLKPPCSPTRCSKDQPQIHSPSQLQHPSPTPSTGAPGRSPGSPFPAQGLQSAPPSSLPAQDSSPHSRTAAYPGSPHPKSWT